MTAPLHPAVKPSAQPVGCYAVVALKNGLLALHDSVSGETMHPGIGPLREAAELYVEPSRIAARLGEAGTSLVVFDVGLGAGSNAALAYNTSEARVGRHGRRLEIVSFEHNLDPLTIALAHPQSEAFGLTRDGCNVHAAATRLLHEGRVETERTTWRLVLGDFHETLLREDQASADVVYWDMYSRKLVPSLWTVQLFAQLRARCREGATLHTYSAATSTRTALLLAGFAVGVGPQTGLKEQTTIAATRLVDLEAPLGAEFMQRVQRSTVPFPEEFATPEAIARAVAQLATLPQFSPRKHEPAAAL